MFLPPDTQPAQEYEDVAEASDEAHHPDAHSQDEQVQQVVDRWDAITLWGAVPDIRCISAVVKGSEGAAR